MPAKTPPVVTVVADKLAALGLEIRLRRKSLRVSATSAAQAAGMSRVTLHRIENGEPSVTMGAYFSAMEALGLDFGVRSPSAAVAGEREGGWKDWIPARVRLADYPQLGKLAWQVHGVDALTPAEALGVYERNWRHIDMQALEPQERQLIDALRLALGEGAGRV